MKVYTVFMKNDDILLFIILLVSLVIFLFLIQKLMYKGVAKKVKKKIEEREKDTFNKCPVCGTSLLQSEQIISRVYSTESKTDQRCTIVGCPHCFPHVKEGVSRKCPVCHKKVPQEGYLIAHLFTRPNKKNHVHIVGCTECHKKINF